MAFFTIYPAPGLPEDVYRRIVRLRAPGLATYGRGHGELLESAGFVYVTEIDVTVEFLRVARGWLEGRERYADHFRAAEGETEFARNQAERRRTVSAVSRGLIRRSLFVAGKRAR